MWMWKVGVQKKKKKSDRSIVSTFTITIHPQGTEREFNFTTVFCCWLVIYFLQNTKNKCWFDDHHHCDHRSTGWPIRSFPSPITPYLFSIFWSMMLLFSRSLRISTWILALPSLSLVSMYVTSPFQYVWLIFDGICSFFCFIPISLYAPQFSHSLMISLTQHRHNHQQRNPHHHQHQLPSKPLKIVYICN